MQFSGEGGFAQRAHSYKPNVLKAISFLIVLLMSCLLVKLATYAEDGRTDVIGNVYEFDDNNPYMFSESENFRESSDSETYGSFFIIGDIADTSDLNGLPSYGVDGNELLLSYIYEDSVLNAKKEEWHLYEDDCETIDKIDLDEDIDKGAIVVQTSRDGEKWFTNKVFANVFEDTPVQTDPFYSVSKVMLDHGSYFRVIVAYETRKLVNKAEDFLFIPGEEKYEYKRHAEVYEFYAYNRNSMKSFENSEKHYFGIKDLTVNTGNNNGYSGHEDIVMGDPHYNWELGDFLITGFTDKTKDEDTGNIVFLKNVGDEITLWFNLKQDINALNGNEDLIVCQDDGYDQAFGTDKQDFGRGTILVRYTDYENKQGKPEIYTNYLEANASPGADTEVKLFEEGDYEVALDYEIEETTHNPFMPFEYDDYRAYIKFSIRNGNCMVYPFDVKTGAELTHSSITENGFRLDLAKSRYLKLSIKKEVLSPGADGLIEDSRFNKVTRDGVEYTDEGIYTITVENKYTDLSTQKVIYVGTDKILKAVVANGFTVQQVNEQVKNGAEIADDGTLVFPNADNNVEIEETKEEKQETEETLAPIIVPFPNLDGSAVG